MPRRCRSVLTICVAVLSTGWVSAYDDPPREAVARLEMAPAVACKKINGFDDYEVLPDAALTSEDKLLVYYRPRNYVIKESKPGAYLAHFLQDSRIRKRGEKAVLWSKNKLLDFKAKSASPPYRVYLSNSIGLKGLPPGDYDLDIILHDNLKPGATATQTLRFKVVPLPKSDETSKDEPEAKPANPPASRKKSTRKRPMPG